MSALGSLVVKLALEYAEYTRGLDKSDQAALKFAQNAQRHFDSAAKASQEFLSNMAKGAVGAVAALVTVNSVIDQLNSSVDRLAALDDLTQKTGASVENLSRLQQVAGAFSHDFGAVDGALSKLAKGMATADSETSKTHKALKALGIQARDAAGNLRDPSEVLVDAAKKLQGYEDGAAKAALMMDLVGKSGADMLPYLNDVADNIDKFTGVSAEAAAQAAKYQDQMGLLKMRHEELVTQLTIAALPAMNDLLEAFLDTSKAGDELTGKDVGGWADDLAVGVARVVDIAKLLPQILNAVRGSFQVVAADVTLMGEVLAKANPIAAAKTLMEGRSPTEELRKAVNERNKVLEEANRRWDDLWNKPVNQLEQATLKRIADRKNAPSGNASPGGGKAPLAYTTGNVREEKNDFDALNKSLQERIALADRELVLGRHLSEAEKQLAALVRARAEGTISLTDAQFKMLKQSYAELESEQRAIASKREVDELFKKLRESSRKAVEAAEEEATKNEKLADTVGMTKTQIEELELARLQQQYDQRSAVGLTLEEIEALEKLIAAKKRSVAAVSRAETAESAKKDLDKLNDFLDPAKAKDFGGALREAFGAAGSSLSKLSEILDSYGKRQAEIQKQRGSAANAYLNGLVDEKKYLSDLSALSAMDTRNRLASYGDMSAAAAGFFGEQSKGYRALMTVSKAFHAAELAMTMAEMVPKAITAVLNQGSGDPYTAFGRMAAMAALVAGLGVAVGGGGGGKDTTAKDRQAAAGTGSVLGNASAKSDSINKSLEIVAQNSGIELSHTAGMLASLRNIESSIAGLGNLLARTEGVNGAVAPDRLGSAERLGRSTITTAVLGGVVGLALDKLTGGFIGKITGKILGSVFGGKVTTTDAGLTAEKASLAAVLADGMKASRYTDTTKSGGWFRSDKHRTDYSPLGSEANDQFTKIVLGLSKSVVESAKLLGQGGDEFTARLNGFVVDIGKISLKDLSAEQIQKQLEAVFAKVGDDMAKFGIGGLEQFQKVGEGYFETLNRIAANYANLDSLLASSGMSFGAVGMASIGARERLIELSGGIDKLADKTASFNQNYLSEAERLEILKKYVTEQMASLGLAHVTTREQFKATAQAIDKYTEAGAKQFAGMMDIEAAFAKVYPEIKATGLAAMSAADILSQRRELQEQLDQQTLSSSQLLAKQRDALHESNRALFDQIQTVKRQAEALSMLKENANAALGRLGEAVEAEKKRLTDQYNADVNALRAETQARVEAARQRQEAANQELSAIRSVFQTLDAASKSSRLETEAGLAARRKQAQSVLASALEQAKGGGSLAAVPGLNEALSDVAKPSELLFSSFADYARDQIRTSNTIGELKDRAGVQVDKAQAAVDAIKATITAIEKSGEEQLRAMEVRHQEMLKKQDQILLTAQQQLAAANGEQAVAKSLAEAAKGFATAIEALKALQPKPANPTTPPDSKPSSPEAQIEALYQGLLGRKSDEGGFKFWLTAYQNGVGIDQIAKDFVNSAEYKRIHGYAVGGDHMGGWRIVGENGPELEATGPARIYSASQTRSLLHSGSDELAEMMEDLRSEFSMLRKAMEEMATSNKRGEANMKDLLLIWRRITRDKDAVRTVAGVD